VNRYPEKVKSLNLDIPLIEYVASKGKPIILSTGIATLEDIELALKTIRSVGDNEIVLLKCTSSYPAPLEEANLTMIQDFKNRFGVISGLSDHTLGSTAAVVATCLGAKIIEKHFILDRSIGGPDASFSLDEKEFTQMVQEVRCAEKAIGKVSYELTEKQQAGKTFSRSLYIIQDIKKGEKFTEKNIRSIRPGFGLHPKHYKDMIGTIAQQAFEKGDRLTL
jgi:pseudaminic acid synthase